MTDLSASEMEAHSDRDKRTGHTWAKMMRMTETNLKIHVSEGKGPEEGEIERRTKERSRFQYIIRREDA